MGVFLTMGERQMPFPNISYSVLLKEIRGAEKEVVAGVARNRFVSGVICGIYGRKL